MTAALLLMLALLFPHGWRQGIPFGIGSQRNGGKTTLATDTFSRANEEPISGGGNWQTDSAYLPMQVYNSIAFPYNPGSSPYYSAQQYSGGISWPANQWSKISGLWIMNAASVDQEIGSTCRSNGAGTFYVALIDVTDPSASLSGTLYLQKSAAGSRTTLASIGETFSAGDSVEIDCQGSSQKVYYNGALVLTGSDTSISSGKPGMYGFDSSAHSTTYGGQFGPGIGTGYNGSWSGGGL